MGVALFVCGCGINYTSVYYNINTIRTQLRQVQQRVGYCPQFDAIIDRLTGRELLTMFARLRGIAENHIKRVVQNEIERLDLTKHANKRCGTYRYAIPILILLS